MGNAKWEMRTQIGKGKQNKHCLPICLSLLPLQLGRQVPQAAEASFVENLGARSPLGQQAAASYFATDTCRLLARSGEKSLQTQQLWHQPLPAAARQSSKCHTLSLSKAFPAQSDGQTSGRRFARRKPLIGGQWQPKVGRAAPRVAPH